MTLFLSLSFSSYISLSPYLCLPLRERERERERAGERETLNTSLSLSLSHICIPLSFPYFTIFHLSSHHSSYLIKFHFILFPCHPHNLYLHPSLHVLVFLFPFSLWIMERERGGRWRGKIGDIGRERVLVFLFPFPSSIRERER